MWPLYKKTCISCVTIIVLIVPLTFGTITPGDKKAKDKDPAASPSFKVSREGLAYPKYIYL